MVLEFFQVLLALPEDLGVDALCRSYSGSIGFTEMEESPLESSNVLPMPHIGHRSFPTGPGPAKKKEWGFSYPHSHGGTESPPSYSRNSGPAGAQRRQPRRRGGQECPPSGGASFLRSPPPPGRRHDPARNWAGMVHQRRPPRCRCPTTRSLLGRGEARRLGRGTMRRRRAPTRGAPTIIGEGKFQRRSGGFPTPTLTGGLKVPPPVRRR